MKVFAAEWETLTRSGEAEEENALVKHLQYDRAFNLAVCMDCGYALPREWIRMHFSGNHKVSV
jgi:hypothetical protein